MAICCNGSSSTINASVGALVWVRRRNGSWWPGQIVGLDELPVSCMQPLRTGTPIKLLGREDGSVDWYNLEKSTRVKAFHCGEYDECIEKAKASANISSKKPANAGKYVRRGDAILHALELEKVHISNGNESFSSGTKNLMVTTDKNLATQSQNMFGHSKKLGYMARKPSRLEGNAIQEPSQSVISFEQQDKLTAADMQFIHRKRRKTPNDSEDDNEGIKRMRDLQDLGLKIVSKTKPNVRVDSDGSHELVPTDASLGESLIANGLYSVSPTSSSKDSCSSLKQKQSQMVQVYENFKRKNRLRTLNKVSMGTVRVKVPSVCRRGAFARQSYLQGVKQNKLRALKSCSNKTEFSVVTDNSPGSSGTSCEENLLYACENACGTEVDGAHLDYEMMDSELPNMLDDCTDGFVNVPVVTEENIAEGFSRPFGPYTSRKLHSHEGENHFSQADLVQQLNEGLSETCSTSSATQVNHVRRRIGNETSEWYSKGKTNASCLSLRRNADSESFVDWTDQNCFLMDERQKEIDNNTFSRSPMSDNSGQLMMHGSVSEVVREVPVTYVNAVRRGFASEDGHLRSTKAVNRLCNSNTYPRDKGDMLVSTPSPQGTIPQHQTRPPTYSRYQGLDPARSMSMDSTLYDVKLDVQGSYQGPREPLVSLVSRLNGKAIVGYPITVEVLESGFVDALVNSSDCHPPTGTVDRQLLKSRGAMIGKLKPETGYAAELRPNANEKISGRSLMDWSPSSKRRSSCGKRPRFSPRKIRRLSSLTVVRRDKEEERVPVMEKLGGPSVSCVPLRLVFSRLNEALSSSAWTVNSLGAS